MHYLPANFNNLTDEQWNKLLKCQEAWWYHAERYSVPTMFDPYDTITDPATNTVYTMRQFALQLKVPNTNKSVYCAFDRKPGPQRGHSATLVAHHRPPQNVPSLEEAMMQIGL